MTNKNNKRYYWLKLNENFFDREEIKVIENMQNGKDYIIFYMKLLLKSISTEGMLRFRGVIPYTPEMLSSITNTDVDTVRVATEMFIQLELMEKWDDGTLFMAETNNMIGSETDSAMRMRRLRAKKEQKELPPSQSDEDVQESDTDIEIDTELDIDKDIDIDLDSDIEDEGDKNITLTKKDIQLVMNEWNKLGLQSLRSINSNTNRHKMLRARANEFSLDEVVQAIRSISKSSFLKGQNKRGWAITFDWLIRPNNFIKVLEGNYLDRRNNNEPEPDGDPNGNEKEVDWAERAGVKSF